MSQKGRVWFWQSSCWAALSGSKQPTGAVASQVHSGKTVSLVEGCLLVFLWTLTAIHPTLIHIISSMLKGVGSRPYIVPRGLEFGAPERLAQTSAGVF